MKRSILFVLMLAIAAVSCVSVNPHAEDAEAALNYGKALMNEGKTALAIVEFKRAREFYSEGGFTYSVFSTYPYIARAYYLSGSRDEAIATYFEGLDYAMANVQAVGSDDIADTMRELAGLLVEAGRTDEARYLLMDAAELYKQGENYEKFNEVVDQLNRL